MRVLHLGRPFQHAVDVYNQFRAKHQVFRLDPEGQNQSEVIKAIQAKVQEDGPFEACLSYGFHGLKRLGEEVFSCLLPEFKVLANSGAGTDIIDIDYMTQHGVYVANTPNAVTKSTADGTAMLILSAIKNQTAVVAQAKSSAFWREDLGLMGDPEDMVLGIIGMGKIGQQVALRMNAFGMQVIYHNRSRLAPALEKELAVKYVSMDTLLEKSDVISLNCPLTPDTRHIINEQTLAKAKNGVMIVNTARGACVETEALIKAIKSGKVSTAALDVFETEPEIPQFFKDSKKVTITPHFLAFTTGTLRKIELALLENLETYVTDGRPIYAVNDIA